MKVLPEKNFKEIIEGNDESIHLEFKRSFDFNSDKIQKEKIIKAVIAMANTQNGGDIVIGINDCKSSFERFEGINEEHLKKFEKEIENLKSQVEKHSSSPVPFEIYKTVAILDSKKSRNYIVIRVPEFEYLPVICKQASTKNINCSSSEGIILESGALYIRSLKDKPSSSKIKDSNDMMELLRRAIGKEISNRHKENGCIKRN